MQNYVIFDVIILLNVNVGGGKRRKKEGEKGKEGEEGKEGQERKEREERR